MQEVWGSNPHSSTFSQVRPTLRSWNRPSGTCRTRRRSGVRPTGLSCGAAGQGLSGGVKGLCGQGLGDRVGGIREISLAAGRCGRAAWVVTAWPARSGHDVGGEERDAAGCGSGPGRRHDQESCSKSCRSPGMMRRACRGLVLVGWMTSSHSTPPYLVRQAGIEVK